MLEKMLAEKFFGHRRSPERHRSVGKKVLTMSLLGGVVGASFGIGHENTSKSEVTVNVGHDAVQEINLTLSKQEVIGFKTKANSVYADHTEKRTGPFGIPLPDLKTSETMNGAVVDSSLCFDAKDKKALLYPSQNKIELHIDPASIEVCSKMDPMIIPDIIPGGSAVELINNASNDIGRAFKEQFGIDLTDPKEIAKENEIKSRLLKTLDNAALLGVNQGCADKVFSAAQPAFKSLLVSDVLATHPGATVEVIFDVPNGAAVHISGKSDIDAYFAEQAKAGDSSYKVGTIGECTLPQDFVAPTASPTTGARQ